MKEAEKAPVVVRAGYAAVRRVAATLEGVEARLRSVGEYLLFREVQPGLLQHACSTAAAVVSFWPSTLRWQIDGAQCESIEKTMLAPFPR